MKFPALFISHGAPNIILHDSPARRFLAGLGRELGRPRALVAISAHWETRAPAINACAHPETIHDFSGFEPEMYEMRYPAPGATGLAREIERLLSGAGMRAALDTARGLDHGVWSPLKLMYPDADIPVTQISVQTLESTQHHLDIGSALRGLREDGVLVFGSGSATHNLREMQPEDTDPSHWVTGFSGWLREAVAAGDIGGLLAYRERAPFAARNHPTEEHFLPLFAAIGAGTKGARGRILHASYAYGALAMDTYAFD